MAQTKPVLPDKVQHAPSKDSAGVLFRLLVDQITDYAIFLLTPTGEVATWNPGAQRFKGYKPEEIIGRHFRTFYPSDAQEAKIPEQELVVAAATGRFEDEGWRVRKDGSTFWANVIITAIRDSSGELIGYGKVTRDLTERKKSEEQLRELSHRLLRMQDEERGRLGRELHDTVGQYLAASKISIDGLLSESSFNESEARARLAESRSLIERAIREVRTLSYLLYPPMLEEMGLPAAIRWHLEEFSKRSGIHTTYEIPDYVRLPKDVELALFRVIQEGLTNILRHAQSLTAEVRLSISDHTAGLEIKDQGRGVPPELCNFGPETLAKMGVGVRGMYERIRQLGGNLSISSNSHGTSVRASVPIKETSYP